MKIKDLKEEHPLIYKRALECQQEQGNEPNDELNLADDDYEGNFHWLDTTEGVVWGEVNEGNFSRFYNLYI